MPTHSSRNRHRPHIKTRGIRPIRRKGRRNPATSRSRRHNSATTLIASNRSRRDCTRQNDPPPASQEGNGRLRRSNYGHHRGTSRLSNHPSHRAHHAIKDAHSSYEKNDPNITSHKSISRFIVHSSNISAAESFASRYEGITIRPASEAPQSK